VDTLEIQTLTIEAGSFVDSDHIKSFGQYCEDRAKEASRSKYLIDV
jgi:hypothetical protein